MAIQVAKDNLETWLANQSDNTIDTPYEIEITGLTGGYSDFTAIHDGLYRNPTKYVDLSATQLQTMNCSQLFLDITTLIKSPKLPINYSSTGDMQSCFKGCTNLVEAPVIPEGIRIMYNSFYGCTSLTEPPIIPDGVNDVSYCFVNCSNLIMKSVIPSSVTESQSCYAGVRTPNWKGTESQAESFRLTFFAQEEDSELRVYNNNRVTYEYSFCNVDVSTLSTYLAGLATNTVSTAYKIYIRGLTTSNASDIKTALNENDTKYVDLRYTTIPNGTNCEDLFHINYSTGVINNLIYSPILPSDVTSLNRTFQSCQNLKEAPVIPSTVTSMNSAFSNCNNLTVAPTIPNGVTSMVSAFVSTAITTAPTIPNSVTTMENCFRGCNAITSTPSIPNSVTNLENTFRDCVGLVTINSISNSVTNMCQTFSGCTALTAFPTIPSSVTDMRRTFEGCSSISTVLTIPNSVTNMAYVCYNCTSLTTVSVIPASVTYARSAFEGCTSLTKIKEFDIALNTLKNNTSFQDMFLRCTSLTEIGHEVKASDKWHLMYLNFGSSDVHGKVYESSNTTPVTIPTTSVTKSTLRLPHNTDELLFAPNMSDSDMEELIVGDSTATPPVKGVLDTHYSWFIKTVIPPTGDNFVIMAKDPNKFTTNLPIGGGGANINVYEDMTELEQALPNLSNGQFVATEEGETWALTDTVANGNMNPVTSNAVAGFIKVTETTITLTANSYTTSSGGMLYKNLGDVSTFIGTGHTLLGMHVSYFTGLTNSPFNVITDNHNANVDIITTSQSLAGTIGITFVYI